MVDVSVSLPRKDKKKEIKAVLPGYVRDLLAVRAEAAGLAPMAYAEKLTAAVLMTPKVIMGLAPFFKRGYVPRYDTARVMMGHVITPSVDPLLPEDDAAVTRFPVKFMPEAHLHVGEVAYALGGCSMSKALTILLWEGLRLEVEAEDHQKGCAV